MDKRAFAVFLTAASAAIGCGADVVKPVPFSYFAHGGGLYRPTVIVTPMSNSTILQADALASGQRHALAHIGGNVYAPAENNGQGFDSCPQGGPCPGMRLTFEAKVRVPAILWGPSTTVRTFPAAGAFIVPVLHPQSDIDGDGNQDRSDGCPFHEGPSVTMPSVGGGAVCGPAGTFGVIAFDMTDADAASGIVVLDNSSGEKMGTLAGSEIFTFRWMQSAVGRITTAPQGLDVTDLSFDIGNCELQYEDITSYGSGGFTQPALNRYIEVYARPAAAPSQCRLRIRRGTDILMDADEVFMQVRTNMNNGLGNVVGRATLLPLPSNAGDQARQLHQALARDPQGYFYFGIPVLRSVETDSGRSETTRALFRGSGHIFFRTQ